MEHWKGMSATMVGRQEKFLNSRRFRMAKIVTFWPWWQPFNSFCFETLSFFPYFFFTTKKVRGPRPTRCRQPWFCFGRCLTYEILRLINSRSTEIVEGCCTVFDCNWGSLWFLGIFFCILRFLVKLLSWYMCLLYTHFIGSILRDININSVQDYQLK